MLVTGCLPPCRWIARSWVFLRPRFGVWFGKYNLKGIVPVYQEEPGGGGVSSDIGRHGCSVSIYFKSPRITEWYFQSVTESSTISWNTFIQRWLLINYLVIWAPVHTRKGRTNTWFSPIFTVFFFQHNELAYPPRVANECFLKYHYELIRWNISSIFQLIEVIKIANGQKVLSVVTKSLFKLTPKCFDMTLIDGDSFFICYLVSLCDLISSWSFLAPISSTNPDSLQLETVYHKIKKDKQCIVR